MELERRTGRVSAFKGFRGVLPPVEYAVIAIVVSMDGWRDLEVPMVSCYDLKSRSTVDTS